MLYVLVCMFESQNILSHSNTCDVLSCTYLCDFFVARVLYLYWNANPIYTYLRTSLPAEEEAMDQGQTVQVRHQLRCLRLQT